MGTVNASTLIATQKTFRALFMESFHGYMPMWMQHAMETSSTNAAEIYHWLGRVAAMREWIDQKATEELRGFDFTIKNKDWESTIEVDRNHIEDDQLGLYRPRIQDLGMRAKQHPDKLLSERRQRCHHADRQRRQEIHRWRLHQSRRQRQRRGRLPGHHRQHRHQRTHHHTGLDGCTGHR